ncbi:MAG: hypothetical protein V1493_05970 [Candidatus Diapherotrites archaeon]
MKLDKEAILVIAVYAVSVLVVAGYYLPKLIQTEGPRFHDLAVTEEPVPSVDRACEIDQGCSATCCGCRNNQYQGDCALTCDQSKLNACVCYKGYCTATRMPLQKTV